MLLNFLLRCMGEWTKIQLSYYDSLNIFVLLPLIFEFEHRLRNQRIPAEGRAAVPEDRLPTASLTWRLPAMFHPTRVSYKTRTSNCLWGLADSGVSPERTPSPTQNGQNQWGSSWKQEISPLRSWWSMWTIEDYALLHITRSAWLSEKLCYSLGLRDHSLCFSPATALPSWDRPREWCNWSHRPLGFDDHMVLCISYALIFFYLLFTPHFPFFLKKIFF